MTGDASQTLMRIGLLVVVHNLSSRDYDSDDNNGSKAFAIPAPVLRIEKYRFIILKVRVSGILNSRCLVSSAD